MSHDSEAAYASGEIADIIQGKAGLFFGTLTSGGTWTLSAGREGSTVWPLADGLIQAKNSKSTVNDVNIAFEYTILEYIDLYIKVQNHIRFHLKHIHLKFLIL